MPLLAWGTKGVRRRGGHDVRQEASAGLGRLGDGSAASPLARLLNDPNPGARAAAAAALRSLGWRPSTPEEQAVFEVALGHTRAAGFAGQAAVTALVNELKNDTSFNRRAAAEALENVDDPRTTQPLLAALRDEDPTVRVSAIHALGKATTAEVWPKLVALFRDREACVRLAAAEVLARRADQALVPEFLRLLTDRNFEVRLSAVKFLSRLREPRIAEALLPLLKDPDGDVRRAVAQALGAIAEPIAVEGLVLALTDEERAVREAADLALRQIDPNWLNLEAAHRTTARLEAALSDTRSWVRSAAAQVLAKLQATAAGVQAAQ